jgi:AraC-like DNA-binding protein
MTARRAGDHVSVERVGGLEGVDLVRARFVTRSTPLHFHADVEVGVVVSGRRLVRYRERTYEAPAGSVLIFEPGEVHGGAPIDDRGSTYRAMLVSPATLAAAGRSAAGERPDSSPRDGPVLRDRALARDLMAAHAALARGESLIETAAGLTAILARVTRCGSPGPAGEARGSRCQVVGRVKAYLAAQCGSKVRLEALSEVSGLSVFHLIRVFRAATGLPPYAYLEQLRVTRATELLRQGQPVSRVAWLTGFADQSHLTRCFKRLVGVPPGRYQRSALLTSPSVVRSRAG